MESGVARPGAADDPYRDAVQNAAVAARELNRAAATRWAAIASAMRWSRRDPARFTDVRLPGAGELAERAVSIELSMRLSTPRNTVLSIWKATERLQRHLPLMWAAFVAGALSERKARAVAERSYTLPDESLSDFDGALEPLMQLTDGKFETQTRRLRDRLHAEPLAVRHELAAARREVEVLHDVDGMSTLMIHGPSDAIARAKAHIDMLAFDLAKRRDDDRTMPQLRADVALDLLIGIKAARSEGHGAGPGAGAGAGAGLGTGPGAGAGVSVAITVPVLSLLDHDDELPTLQGVGPISIATAKRLIGEATSFTRILTDPIDRTVVDIDRKSRRIPADLKRWLGVIHETCARPGCSRPADQCDIDHTEPWANRGAAGRTALSNLAPLCRPDHRAKEETTWKVEQVGSGPLRWTSPSGYSAESDKAPF